jgi:hypothetical protein
VMFSFRAVWEVACFLCLIISTLMWSIEAYNIVRKVIRKDKNEMLLRYVGTKSLFLRNNYLPPSEMVCKGLQQILFFLDTINEH